MTQDELMEKLSYAAERNEIGEDFGGSAEEAAERNGKAEAFSAAYGWVDRYFKQLKAKLGEDSDGN